MRIQKMTDRLIVEYVCTGNNGRSPMAEAIALDYVHRKGLEDRIEVCSSASGLSDKTRSHGDEFRKQQLGIVKLALQNGIYQETWRQKEAQRVIDLGNEKYDEEFDYMNATIWMEDNCEALKNCVNYAVNMEAHFRNVALMEVGLFAGGKYHKPTVARHHDLILPMAESNATQVRTIYEGFSFTTKIRPLNAYVGVEGDVPNPFCKLLAAYQASRDHLMKVVPMSIEKAVAEYL